MKLARTEARFAKLEAYAEKVRPLGLDVELIGGNAVRERFPWLPGDVAGASLCAEDDNANPRLVSPAFARAAQAKLDAFNAYMKTANTLDWDAVNEGRQQFNSRWNRTIEK